MSAKLEFLKTLARCRVATPEMIENLLKISESTTVECLSEKLVSMDKYRKDSVEKTYYVLTSKGEQYIKQELPEIKCLYRGFVLEQDLSLMEFYGKLEQNLRDTWITKDDFIVQYQLSGTVDGAYRNDKGEVVAVKVLSKKSSFSAVERVENFLKQANIEHIHYLMYNPS